MEVSHDLKEAYDANYTGDILEWRELAAKQKAANVLELTREEPIRRVLDVGCGEGSVLQWISRSGVGWELYGLEVSRSGIEQSRLKEIKFLEKLDLFDGYSIPFESDFFDLVICSHVMEHVEHPRILMREIRRVSKNQFYEIPIDFSFNVDQKLSHYVAYGHINIFTPALFRYLLFTEGHKIIRDKCAFYPNEVIKRIYQKNYKRLLMFMLRRFLSRVFPFVLRIKPSYYSVLVRKDEKENTVLK